MTVSRPILLPVLLVLASLIWTLPAQAHRSNIFAWAEGDTIHCECAFSGGKSAMGAPIRVLDNATDILLTEGRTDDAGLWSFAIPDAARKARMDLKLELLAGEGHRGEWIITAEEYLGAAGSESATASTTGVAPAPDASGVAAPPVSATAGSAALSLDEATLRRIVEEALDKRIAPLNHKLAAMSDPGPTTKDVFGGIGYILGLFGIAAYFKSKKHS
ncbi:MAG: hypothetical protein KKE73_12820 [Proteobacteria bacterium]|nr:hypothetical protein [Pseudomonadota bacterium]